MAIKKPATAKKEEVVTTSKPASTTVEKVSAITSNVTSISAASKPTISTTVTTASRVSQTPKKRPTNDEISTRAYHIWKQEGCPKGKEQEHWYRAERDLLEGRY